MTRLVLQQQTYVYRRGRRILRSITLCSDTAFYYLHMKIGVAMGHGAALAMETADVTLLDSNLEKLACCIETGKRVTRKIKENVLFSIVVKLVVLGFAIAGMTQLWVAIASDVGSMILVTLNAMAILPKRQKNSVSENNCDIENGCVAPIVPTVQNEKGTGVCSSGCCEASESKSCS